MKLNYIKIKEKELLNVITSILNEQLFSSSKQNINPKNLKLGDGGPKSTEKKKDVIDLQNKLIKANLLKISTPTGYFGNLTQSALNNYLRGTKGDNTNNINKTIKPSRDGRFSKQVNKQIDYLRSINFNEPCTILDDAKNLLHVFNENLTFYKTYRVNTGLNPGDFFDNDTVVSYTMKNLGKIMNAYKFGDNFIKHIENYYYAAKNNLLKNTPNGIFKRTSLVSDWLNNAVQTYFAEEAVGPRVIQFEKLDGTNIAHGFHGTKNQKRLDALKGGDVKARNLTYGCVNFTDKDIAEINKFISYGQYTFWLSDVNTNKIETFPNNKF